jgi:hypothetical protein
MPRLALALLVLPAALGACGQETSTTSSTAPAPPPQAAPGADKTERGIAALLEREAPEDAPGFAVRSVECPPDFRDEAGQRTTCVAIANDGSEYDFDVRSGATRTSYTLKGGRWPGYSLASRVLPLYQARADAKPVNRLECRETLEFDPGATVRCTIEFVGGRARDLEVTSTNVGGGIRFAFAG